MIGDAGRRAVRHALLLLTALVAIALPAGSLSAQSGEGGVRGTLQYTPAGGGDKVPFAGGEIVVLAAELSPDGRTVVELGDEVARGASAEDGTFFVPLDTPGDYAVQLDTASLPDGVSLVNADRQQLPLRLATNQAKNVLFNLAEGGAGATAGADAATGGTAATAPARGESVWWRAARLAIEGLRFGLIIGLCAIGLSMIYATTGLTNFAHAEMITLGAVTVYALNVGIGIHLLAAIPLGMFVGGLFGAGLDIGLWRPLRRRGTGTVAAMIVSIGLAVAMRYIILYFYGDRSHPFNQYAVSPQVLFGIGKIGIRTKDFLIIVISAAVLISVALLLRLTKLGKAMRAVSDNPDLAASTGIDVNRTVTFVWFMAGALVTLGAAFQGLSELTDWQMGNQLLLLVFAGLTLGGLGTAYGAMVGSVVVGIFIMVSTVWTPPGMDDVLIAPEMKNVGALLIMILLLLVRPQGLFGRRERIG